MNRYHNILELLSTNSYFFFGARGVGKSYWLREAIKDRKDVDYIDLLHSKNYLLLKNSPHELENLLKNKMVIIDEIQRIPELLNEVHRLIESKKINFFLTGSSARSLKRAGVNLLAGRAYKSEMLPLTWFEIRSSGDDVFDLDRFLLMGGLPNVYIEKKGFDYLYAYVDTYLREEIQAESFVRNLSNYSRFLESAALSNTEVVNFTKVANDAQLSPNTVRDYYQILQDTLLGFMVTTWNESTKRKAIQAPKFYFVDTGPVHALLGIESLSRNTDTYGKAFEHFIAMELKAYLTYKKIRIPLKYWRSTSHFEVDFILNDEIGIEVKSSKKVVSDDSKGLRAISEERKWKKLLLVSQDQQEKHFDNGVEYIYWVTFLENLWNDRYM